MCYGISGSSSLKSKADALKYAIEFTATGEYPNRLPDMTKAKELFDFICENVQLPDVETDQLSNSLNGFTSMMERLSEKKKEAQDKVNEAVGTVEGFVEGEKPVKEESAEVECTTEPLKEAVELPKGKLRYLYNQFVSQCVENGLHSFRGEGHRGYMKECFTRNEKGEYIRVTLEHSVAPEPNEK